MVAILTSFEKKSNKVKKPQKKKILSHGVLLCVLVAIKNDKFDFSQIVQKKSSQKGLSVGCMPKRQCIYTSGTLIKSDWKASELFNLNGHHDYSSKEVKFFKTIDISVI